MRSLVALTLLISACRGPSLDVTATVNETTATVVELTWATSEPGISWVEFGTTEDYGLITSVSAQAGTDHHFPLFGLPPLSTVYYRAVTEIDGVEYAVQGETANLGLPSELPDVTVTVNDTSLTSSEPYMMALLVGSLSAILVVDREGNVVWYRELESSVSLGAPVFGDVQFAVDGNDLIYNRFTADIDDPEGYNTIFRVSLTGELIDERPAPLHHHAFTQLGDGRYAYVAADMRDYQLPGAPEPTAIVGDAIVVLEEDGSTQEVFNTWDDWDGEVAVSQWAVPFYGNIPDWTHANGLFWYPEDDTFLLSAAYARAVIEIDGSTGQVLRDFGRDADVPVAAGSPELYFQHDAHWTDTGNMLMTTRYVADDLHPDESVIIGIEYALQGGELNEVWSYGKDADIDSIAEGQVRRMANGNTMINWGFSSICREVTPSGELAWELEGLMGAAMVRVRPVSSFYEGN